MSEIVKYRPDIDGLRAVAVSAVVLYHAGVPQVHGGFVGVDVFFVISGYLITGILYREMSERRFSLASFYERRVRRLLPTLFAMIAVTGVVSWFVLLPDDFSTFGRSVVATLLFVANIFFWRESSNYFDAPAHLKPLLHAWSLGVEEQFYILFPLFLLLAIRFLPWRALPALLLVGFLGSFALSVWGVANAPVATFYLLPTRAWELLAGAALGIGMVPSIRSGWLRESSAILGFLLIVLSIYLVTPETPFPGWAALPSCLGAALIIHANTGGRTVIGALLSQRPLVFIGLISYSLYLVHWPIFVLVGYAAIEPLGAADITVCLLTSFGLAALSWRYIERPFRGTTKDLLSRKLVFASAGLGMVMLGTGGSVLALSGGLPQRMSEDVLQVLDVQQYVGDERHCHLALRHKDDELCVRGGNIRETFMLLGDSHAGAIAPGLVAAAREAGRAGLQFSEPGYGPTIGFLKWGETDKFRILNERLVNLLRQREQIKEVFIVVYWHQAIVDNRYWNEAGVLVDGKTAVSEGLRRLAEMFPTRKFVLVHAPPRGSGYGYHVEARRRLFGIPVSQTVPRAEYLEFRRSYEDILKKAADLPNVTVIDPLDLYCGVDVCPGLLGGTLLYRDDNHLSAFGSDQLVSAFLDYWSGKGDDR